jgi:hypothetical protein
MLYKKSIFVVYDKNVDPKIDSSISKKQNNYLLKEIEFKSDKDEYMQFLFSVIVIVWRAALTDSLFRWSLLAIIFS